MSDTEYTPLESARELLTAARKLYSFDQSVLVELGELAHRIDQPLRVALVGSVKAGKSTLLNGLLGERIAPTDARECTRIVTWYHYGATPKVRAHLTGGSVISIPAKRQQERLELDLQGLTPDEFDRLDVTWPAPGISGITLIDTPGTASISHDVSNQTNKFLLPEQGAAGADAVIYLLRSLHKLDIHYMQSLHERTRHGNAAIGSIAVLSRADELGAGRLSAMVSINQAVEHLRNHPDLSGVCETIVPVAGLMGLGSITLRQRDFTTLRGLASRDPDETRQLLVSGERFITDKAGWLPSERTRIDLVDRFGMYGIKLALASLRGGVDDAATLSAELFRRSGLEELRRVIDVHFTQRQSELKAHSIVLALHRVLRSQPVSGSEDLLLMADEHMARAHTFTEMQLVGSIAGGQLNLPAEQVTELERLIGGRGSSPEVRLGYHNDAPSFDEPEAIEGPPEELLKVAAEQLSRWRELIENPLLDRETAQACRVAERSCESIIVTLMGRQKPRVSTVG